MWCGLHRAPRGAPEATSAPTPGPLLSHRRPPNFGKGRRPGQWRPNATGSAGKGIPLAGWHLPANPSSIPCLLRALGQSLPLRAQFPCLETGVPPLSPKGTGVLGSRKPLYLQGLAPSCPSSNSCHRPPPRRPRGAGGGAGLLEGLSPSPLPGCPGKGASAPRDLGACSFLWLCSGVNKAFVNSGDQRFLFSEQTREGVAPRRWGGEVRDCHRLQGCTESMKMPVGSLGEKSAPSAVCKQTLGAGECRAGGVRTDRCCSICALPTPLPFPPLASPPLPSFPLCSKVQTSGTPEGAGSPHPPHRIAWQVVYTGSWD